MNYAKEKITNFLHSSWSFSYTKCFHPRWSYDLCKNLLSSKFGIDKLLTSKWVFESDFPTVTRFCQRQNYAFAKAKLSFPNLRLIIFLNSIYLNQLKIFKTIETDCRLSEILIRSLRFCRRILSKILSQPPSSLVFLRWWFWSFFFVVAEWIPLRIC